MQKIVSGASDRTLTFKVERGQQQVDLTATPERKDVKGPFGTSRIGVLGVTASTDPADVGPRSSVSGNRSRKRPATRGS